MEEETSICPHFYVSREMTHSYSVPSQNYPVVALATEHDNMGESQLAMVYGNDAC